MLTSQIHAAPQVRQCARREVADVENLQRLQRRCDVISRDVTDVAVEMDIETSESEVVSSSQLPQLQVDDTVNKVTSVFSESIAVVTVLYPQAV